MSLTESLQNLIIIIITIINFIDKLFITMMIGIKIGCNCVRNGTFNNFFLSQLNNIISVTVYSHVSYTMEFDSFVAFNLNYRK